MKWFGTQLKPRYLGLFAIQTSNVKTPCVLLDDINNRALAVSSHVRTSNSVCERL